MSFLTTIKNEISVFEASQVGQFFARLIHSNVEAIIPIAQAAITGLVTAEATAVATGDSKDTGHILAAQVKATVDAVKTAGINATESEILTAVGVAKSQ